MGTASLVTGIVLIGFGFVIFFRPLEATTDEELAELFLGRIGVVIAFIIGGGILLWKYDRDRKKEKNS